MSWVRHLGAPGRLYDPAVGLGVVYSALLSTFLPVEGKQNFKIQLIGKDNNLNIFLLIGNLQLLTFNNSISKLLSRECSLILPRLCIGCVFTK